jgi:hypothetical protein
MQNKTRNIRNLVAKSLRDFEQAKLLLQSSGEAADKARELGVPLNSKIGPLRQRKRGPQIPVFAQVVDNLPGGVTHAWKSVRFNRFSVLEWKEPKPDKKAKTTEAQEIPPPGFVAGDPK